jgi:hypothetical protein
MPHFMVRQGKRYLAEISLSWWEAVAGNDTVAKKIADVGFTEVEVRGGGREREAKALWPLADATAEVPRQIKKIVEIA